MWCHAIQLLSSCVNPNIPGTLFPCHVMQCNGKQYTEKQAKNNASIYVHYTNSGNLVKPPEVHIASLAVATTCGTGNIMFLV